MVLRILTRRSFLGVPLLLMASRVVTPARAGESLDRLIQEDVERLEPRLINSPFHLIVERPFMVIGNESAEKVRQRAEGTVRWAYQQLQRTYFDTVPEEPIRVWICRDAISYQQVAQQELQMDPSSPFGFYQPNKKTIVVNIATGAGTLVHELVHSLVAVDFPDCPPWFNEGLASLYEQCEERDGRIWGLPNWRLRGLQKAAERNQLLSLERLCQQGMDADYLKRDPIAYAQCRYLCLYLQERDQLNAYYRLFRKQHRQDPTGYASLVEVLNGQKAEDFFAQWKAFIVQLTNAS